MFHSFAFVADLVTSCIFCNFICMYFTAPEPVENALVTVVGNIIKITWSPPFISNGEILQYIVQRVDSNGKSYHHISGNRNYLELPSYNNALIFISAVNQYGQSSFEVAKSNGNWYDDKFTYV